MGKTIRKGNGREAGYSIRYEKEKVKRDKRKLNYSLKREEKRYEE
jgi:hypothetical protein